MFGILVNNVVTMLCYCSRGNNKVQEIFGTFVITYIVWFTCAELHNFCLQNKVLKMAQSSGLTPGYNKADGGKIEA